MVIYIVQSYYFEYETTETRIVSAFSKEIDAKNLISALTDKFKLYEPQEINSDFVEDGCYDSYFEYQAQFTKEMLELDPTFKEYVLDANFEYASFYYDILEIELR